MAKAKILLVKLVILFRIFKEVKER